MAKRIDIRTAEELMKIGTDGEYPSDGIYTLKADIKIDAPWTPLPNAAGIEIYGEGCWIGPLDAPLFESITSGVIQHVRVEVSIDGRESGKPVGGIAREGVRMDMDACEVYGSITGVSLVGGFFGSMTDSDVWGLHNYANISATSGIVGGILGLGRGNRFRDCWNHGVISALGINGDTKGFAGGIVGIETPALRSHEAEPREPFIEFCFNRGAVEAFANGGGIVGNVAADEALESQTPFTILWCGNYGEVTASAKGLAAHGGNKNFGGIAGRVDRPCFITECYNQNKVCGGAFVGGIVGSASGFASGGRTESDGVMESCVNHDLICQSIGECGSVCGDADAEGCAGGIVGASISFGGIFSCTNKMTICANANNAGGIAGKFENCEMQNCTNEGYVSSNASSAGGIVGVVSSTSDAAEPASIVKCGNHGEVEGSGESVGGIAGLISGNVIINGCASFGSVRGNSADGVGGIAGSVCNANCDELGSLGAIKESLVLCPYVKGASNVHKAIGSLKCRLDGLCVKVDDRVQLQRADGTRANAGNAPAFPPLEDSDETQTELDGDIVEDASELAAAFRHNK